MNTRRLFLAALALLIALPAAAQNARRGTLHPLDVPYLGTPHEAVRKMLELAKVGPNDIVYDLGSGDGRIVIAAARDFKAKLGVGVDLDYHRVLQGQENARKAGVADRTRFIHGDAFKVDFSEATVLAMFMSPRINAELMPRILTMMKPGSRVVVYRFPVGNWQPQETAMINDQIIRLWVVPERPKP
jgi:cyclopropane fatty-acyl-phospholipid synthase-like methyltransferase